MKKILCNLFVFVLASCVSTPPAPSAQSIQTAIVQTQVVQVTPLSEINLDSIPFQPGDLPNQYKSGQISYKWVDDLPKKSEPDNVVTQKVGWDISSGLKDDYVMIALFKSKDDLSGAFNAAYSAYITRIKLSKNIGEQSAFVMVSPFSGDGFFAFTRCSALVVIRITGADVDEDLLTSYAQRIDKRLKPLACQE